MKALLDTHAFLWWTTDDPRLSNAVRALLEDGENAFLLSAASAWEIVIKARTGKLTLPERAGEFIQEQLLLNDIDTLAIELKHVLEVHHLPDHHRDPFDRLLIAQSRLERLPIVTADPLIRRYQVETIW